MACSFQEGWDLNPDNNNGATEEEIKDVLITAELVLRFEPSPPFAGVLQNLTRVRDSQEPLPEDLVIIKGIHQFDPNPHITIVNYGQIYHVNLVGTAVGGRAGFRVSNVTIRPAGLSEDSDESTPVPALEVEGKGDKEGDEK